MLKIDIYQGKWVEREEIEVNEEDITKFESINRKSYTKKGNFKKFYKTYYIQIKDQLYEIPEWSFKFLKEQLKGKYQSLHNTETVYKNYSERKATNWCYRMK